MEGSGVVVDSGGVLGQFLLGRRVACMATSDSGTQVEYAVANVSQCIPLWRHISDEQGALAFVVPLTA
jgi:NADPH:quinone reductase-like Zn-dependent oxidoreductase